MNERPIDEYPIDQSKSAALMPMVVEMRKYQLSDWQRRMDRIAAGEFFVLADAKTPLEILRAMDIPFVVTQWWATFVSEAQEAGQHLAALKEAGYPDDYAQYQLMALGSVLGTMNGAQFSLRLPKPGLVITENSMLATNKAMELWTTLTGTPVYTFHLGAAKLEPSDWWDTIRHEWEPLLGRNRLDLTHAQTRELIQLLESMTGKRLDEGRLAEVLDLVNEQEEYNARTRQLIADTEPAPVGIADTIAFVMAHQWLRGTEWARDAARDFYHEVKRMSDETSDPPESMRLMWIGNGLFHDTGYWERVEKRHDARFVWSIYLGLAADGYLRYGDDLTRTLASRVASMQDILHSPPWNSRWYAKEARNNRVDGAINLNLRGSHFIVRELEAAGIPVLDLSMNPLDGRAWDEDAVESMTATFLEERVAPVAGRRRMGEAS